MAKRFNIYVLLSLSLLMIACDGSAPRSGGQPYDVVVVASDDMVGHIVMREMEKCKEYYTDDEPTFNLSLTKKKGEDDIIRLARTLIIVDTAEIDNTIAMRELNVWARPQLVLYVRTPSAKQMAKDFNDLRDLFAREINDFERNILLKRLNSERNLQLEDSVKRYTGMEMFVPASMMIAHAEMDFVWLTANSANDNHSLCVYRTHRKDVDIKDMSSVTAFRDSVMQRNIRGYNKDAKWHITPSTERAETRNDTVIVRNRWEMVNDAMGGPSACRIMERNDSVTFIETFIYSPATKKRFKMARMEGLLFSCKL